MKTLNVSHSYPISSKKTRNRALLWELAGLFWLERVTLSSPAGHSAVGWCLDCVSSPACAVEGKTLKFCGKTRSQGVINDWMLECVDGSVTGIGCLVVQYKTYDFQRGSFSPSHYVNLPHPLPSHRSNSSVFHNCVKKTSLCLPSTYIKTIIWNACETNCPK